MRIRNLLEVRFLIDQLYLDCNNLEEQIKEKSFELAVAMTKLNRQDQESEDKTRRCSIISTRCSMNKVN